MLKSTAFGLLLLQTLPPLPYTDFNIKGSLDAVVSLEGNTTYKSNNNIIIAGWTFECRSGLQPFTQRIGNITVFFKRIYSPPFGEVYQSNLTNFQTNNRPDVAIAFQNECPAVGQNVGFTTFINTPHEFGYWTMVLTVSTMDGAGRKVDWTVERDIFLN